PNCGGPRDFLETAADGVFEAVRTIEVGCEEGRHAGQDPDDQQRDEEFLLQAAGTVHVVVRISSCDSCVVASIATDVARDDAARGGRDASGQVVVHQSI